MKKIITPNQIKKNNRNLIYQYIYTNRKVSQQRIAYDLHLSRPTVASNLALLEEDGLIKKNGQMDTETVGRKAAAYSIVPDHRIGIGAEILKKEVKMIAVDLYGEKISGSSFEIVYENKEEYFREVCREILRFKEYLGIREEQILGIGLAMQALVSPDHGTIIYGEILSCTGLSVEAFTRHLPYPCSFIHDADSAAVSELWVSPELKDGVYLSLSRHLGASIISKGELLSGKHGHSATIEHIQMEPDGKACYCGKRGCAETLCSLEALLEGESLEGFFGRLKKKEKDAKERWETYLFHLARLINMLHLIYDTDFILGGYLAPYLKEGDIFFLHDLIQEMTPFPEERDFIHISKMPKHNITIGAALPYIQEFLNHIAGV